jgi:hypothetical protein
VRRGGDVRGPLPAHGHPRGRHVAARCEEASDQAARCGAPGLPHAGLELQHAPPQGVATQHAWWRNHAC